MEEPVNAIERNTRFHYKQHRFAKMSRGFW